MRRRTPLVWSVAALFLFWYGSASSVVSPDQPMLGQPAPSFRLVDLSGKTLTLQDLDGRFVVLHFGTSW